MRLLRSLTGKGHRDLGVGEYSPAPRTPTQRVETGFMANAWMRVRHPDYDNLRCIRDDIGERIAV